MRDPEILTEEERDFSYEIMRLKSAILSLKKKNRDLSSAICPLLSESSTMLQAAYKTIEAIERKNKKKD